ncbi:DUF1801 domain-containing protein [Candidatus Gracilibacteria bacterium]|nr:DUF1801 domain-containing protein [Candidatus Gracilibacteria bacterium]
MNTVDNYIQNSPPEREESLNKIRDIMRNTLVPLGFEEQISYGIPGYIVPFSLYPLGYHCDTSLPLPFAAFASQKHGIHLYHMGIYSDKKILDWWTQEYEKRNIGKLDMGKSCIRFKNPSKIPYDLIEELMMKISATEWIEIYVATIRK